jgi:cytochrome c
MSIRRSSPIVWLAALAAAATVSACATQPAAEPAAKPAASSTPAAPSATAAAKPMTPPAAFAICAACHGTTANAPPGLGPNLFGVVGRKAGSLPDYDYSDAMKASGKVWTVDALDAFVTDPGKAVPGNKMDYDGADAASAKAIAEYMASLK